MKGELYAFFRNDHKRLDELLSHIFAPSGEMNSYVYDEFRKGILKHISLEEKLLLPTVQRLQGGTPYTKASQIKLDHGALAALLVPPPSPKIIAIIRGILQVHNRIEEETGGMYEVCEKLVADDLDSVLEKVKAFPDVPLNPNNSNPEVLKATRRAVERAGYNYDGFS